MSDSKRATIGDVSLRVTKGTTPKLGGFTKSGVSFVKIESITGEGQINPAKLAYINEETNSLLARSILQKDDLLFSIAGTIGRVARVTSEVLPANTNQALAIIRPDQLKVDVGYLLYCLRDKDRIQDALSLVVQSVQANLSLSELSAIQIPLPELSEQRAIAEVLGALDDKIAANNKLAVSTAGLATMHFSRSHQSSNEIVRLSELVSTQYGVTTSAHESAGPKFLRVTDINKKPWVEWDNTPNCTVSDLELDKYRLSPGDILVARMADPGKAAFIDSGDPEAVFASYLVRLKPHDPAQALYLYYFLRSPQYLEYAEGAMTGSVQKNMNAKFIVATDVALPGADVILQFNETVRPLRRLIQSQLNENRKLIATRDALLPQLMSGKLRVKDAERVLEDAGV